MQDNPEIIIPINSTKRIRVRNKSGAAVLLERAASLMSERGKEYDKTEGERSALRIVTAFNAITGRDLTEAEGWLFLQLLKQVRLFNKPGYHADSAEDNVSYAALLGEAKAKEAILEP